MIIGIPKERNLYEYRVGMTPKRVAMLTAQGHSCLVETGAGTGSGYPDDEYEQAGARIVYSHDETFRRADLILKIQRPGEQEIGWMKPNQTIMALMMIGTIPDNHIKMMKEKGVSVIAYELIKESDGFLPVLYPLSQIGGRMTAQIAAQYLQNDKGGRGMLLGGVTGVAPAEVAIIGAGVVGTNAARAFLGMGARVILLDKSLQQLEKAQDQFGEQITTLVSYDFHLTKICTFVDVLVGAVQVPGQRVPKLITRAMVSSMRPRSLIIDMSIDQGGCVETSRPTHYDNPTYMDENVIHYCVPNVPGVVGRTATQAFLNATWEYIKLVVDHGIGAAIESNFALKQGYVIHKSEMTAAPAN